MAETWLICEGEYDPPVLNAVFTNVLSADIILKPSSGSKSAPSAAAYVRKNYGGVTAAYLEDRDYRLRAAADASFWNNKPGFIWRRHAMESYLIEPGIIVEAFRALKRDLTRVPSGGPAWVKALPEDNTSVTDGLRECAKVRAPEEALRMAVHRLWEDLSSTAGQVQRRVPTFRGATPPDAAICRAALLTEANRLGTMAHAASISPLVDPTSVGSRYDTELARVQQQSYVDGMQFLEEFHGRDLLAAFCEWLKRKYQSNLTSSRLTEELVKALPIVYQQNRSIHGTDDFLDLANGVRALAGLPPVT